MLSDSSGYTIENDLNESNIRGKPPFKTHILSLSCITVVYHCGNFVIVFIDVHAAE